MKSFDPSTFISIFQSLGINAKLRDDDIVIAMDKDVEGFCDADGDECIYFGAEVPYQNLIQIRAVSLFKVEDLSEELKEKFIEYNLYATIGAYLFNSDNSEINWQAQFYVNENNENIVAHIKGVLSNFRSHLLSLKKHQEGQHSHENIDQARKNLEENFSLESEIDCDDLEIIKEQQSDSQKSDDEDFNIDIQISDRLHPEVKREVECKFNEINRYIKKIQLKLPQGYLLRIQHGNNDLNVESGFNKGPYVCIIDNNGMEKKNMKLFMSRRGNLNSYIAVSTILKRA